MRGDCAQGHLNDPQRGDHKEIFHRGFLRWSWLQSQQRIAFGHGIGRRPMFLRTEIPDHSADSSQEQHKADHAPDDRSASWPVTDQLFVRPVLRIADVLTRPIGARPPCGPPEERSHLPLFCWVTQSTCRNCVCVPALAIHISVVACQLLECRRSINIKHDRIAAPVIGIVPGKLGQPSLKAGARLCRHGVIIRKALLARPPIQHDL